MEAGEAPGRAFEDAPGEIAVASAGEAADVFASACPFLFLPEQPRSGLAFSTAAPERGTSEAPGGAPEAECTADGARAPLGARQRRYVCAGTLFPSCPRYLRATLPREEAATGRHVRPAPREPVGRISSLPRSTLVSMLLVAASIAASAFGVAAGVVPLGGAFPADARGTGMVAGRTAFASASDPAAGSGAVASPARGAGATSAPSASSPSAAPSPAMESWPPGATESRMTLLRPCADRSACYVYAVRGGDNLVSIANFFGVSRPRIEALNPWLASRTIWPGDALRIPPPSK